MIVVHHLNNSRSQRVLWLLEELGLKYEIVRYQRDAKTMLAPPSLRAIHPLGKSPVITDGDVTVAESGAIIEYLVERYGNGKLVPAAGTPDKLRWRYFMHYAEGSLMTPLLMKLVFDRVESAPAPFFVKPIAKAIAHKVKSTYIQPQIASHLDYLEGELAKAPWFSGAEFGAADVQMSFPLEAAAARGGLSSVGGKTAGSASGGASANSHPKLMAFLERIHARPAYKKALEAGGPYELLK
ncbi:glutathione S-transferase [Pseudoduganella ginsengisoli]|uniref:glutathione transferase n=1 Tax=Pseudoduganella ginsengisoli TaxID=1462440 RepID=A0A6L6PV14_9BURK|nr:glutathione S-transferase [Pseudoduganella ginsengisoli]MTW01295.1 glutathione S-transferase [Pseudoduganella ginsengisoli]